MLKALESSMVLATLTQALIAIAPTDLFLDDDWIGGSCVIAAQQSTAIKLVTLLLGGR